MIQALLRFSFGEPRTESDLITFMLVADNLHEILCCKSDVEPFIESCIDELIGDRN